jgi:preprotein translocase subunit SecA
MSFIDRAFRMGEGKQFRSYEKRVARINGFEEEVALYEDHELREAMDELRERAGNG